MKGVIFTGVMEAVDAMVGEGITDAAIAGCSLSSGGAYTAVGTYDPGELHALLNHVSASTGIKVSTLQRRCGAHLFGRFVSHHPALFARLDNPLCLIEAVEDEIHAEVRKLYPEAGLPSLITHRRGPSTLVLRYRSARDLPDLCEGLLRGCLRHFGREGRIERMDGRDAEGRFTDFAITLTTEEPV